MTDHTQWKRPRQWPGKRPHNAPLVVEAPENLTFSVNRKVFVSEDILESEQRAIFDKCWTYVGHASEIKNPGDFVTRSVAGRPVIFCRDRKGEVRALFNVCRHRGALVCPRAGRQHAAVPMHLSRLDVQPPTARSRASPATTPIRRVTTSRARA